MNLKKWKGIYQKICWDRALVLGKKNLPGRGLTKVEKHWYKALLENNDNKTSPSFKPFVIGNMSDKFVPTRTLLHVSFRHIFISLISFIWIPHSLRILYKTSLLTES